MSDSYSALAPGGIHKPLRISTRLCCSTSNKSAARHVTTITVNVTTITVNVTTITNAQDTVHKARAIATPTPPPTPPCNSLLSCISSSLSPNACSHLRINSQLFCTNKERSQHERHTSVVRGQSAPPVPPALFHPRPQSRDLEVNETKQEMMPRSDINR